MNVFSSMDHANLTISRSIVSLPDVVGVCCGSPWLISILFLHWLFLIAIMLLCLLRFWFLTIALIYISLYCWTINGLECEAMHICVWIHSDQLFVVMYSYQCSSKLLFIICGIDFPRYFLHIFDKIYPS